MSSYQENASKSVLATISFRFPNEEERKETIVEALPIDVNDIHPDARRCNTFYHYSGRHDDGNLPILRNSGPMVDVLSAIQQIKHMSDTYLTERINAQYGYSNNETNNEVEATENCSNEIEESKLKKMRVENEAVAAMEE